MNSSTASVTFRGRARPGRAHRIIVTPDTATRASGDYVQLSARVQDRYGNLLTSASPSWATSSEAIALVSDGGLTRAISAGLADITASYNDLADASAITVTEAEPVDTLPVDTVPGDTIPGDTIPRDTVPAASGDVLFATSWSAATGSGAHARTDGGRLTDYAWSSSILSVVSRSSVAELPTYWPTNALRIAYAGQAAQLVGAANAWPAPVAGATICFRFLAYNALAAGSAVANEHGMQSNVGAVHHFWQFFSPEANGSGFLGFGGSGTSGNDFATIPAGRPIRLEWCLTRTTGTRATVEIQLTDESTGQVYTNADFRGQWGEGSPVLIDRELSFSSESDGFRSYHFGASGSSNGTGSIYVSGFAVCSDWCGAYAPGEGS